MNIFQVCVTALMLPFGLTAAAAGCPLETSTTVVEPTPARGAAKDVVVWLECFDGYSGRPADCGITYNVIGIKPPDLLASNNIENNGGHLLHGAQRPLALADARNPGGAVLCQADTDPAPLSVAGSTLRTPPLIRAEIIYHLPEVSGKIVADSQLIAPFGYWFCHTGTAPRGRRLQGGTWWYHNAPAR